MKSLISLFAVDPDTASTPADLSRWLETALHLQKELPRFPLSPEERRGLSPWLFNEAFPASAEVIRALRREPAAFPELAGQAGDLDERLIRALFWLRLATAFGELQRRCLDLYLREETTVTRRVLGILKHVRAGSQSAFPHPQALDRERLLAAAVRALGAWRSKKPRR